MTRRLTMTLPVALLALSLAAPSLTACATAQPRAQAPGRSKTVDGVQGAVLQPFSDLSLMRGEVPPVLAAAAATPYAAPADLDCASATVAIAALDANLGPDVDAPPTKGDGVGLGLVTDAIKGATSIPFRGVVRRLSGAETRDRQKARAILAGMTRRGFLKGWVAANHCPIPPHPGREADQGG